MATDAQCLDAWNAGDAAAGEALFERYFDGLYRFFASKVGHGIDDLVQETFLACAENRERVRDGSSFRAFIYGVAWRRLCRKWRDEYSGRAPLNLSRQSVADLGPSPSTGLRADEEQAALLDALRQIPAELQTVVELFYWEGLTSAEIGAVMSIPDGTARSRLRRAREQLRELLATAGFGVVDVEASVRLVRSCLDR